MKSSNQINWEAELKYSWEGKRLFEPIKNTSETRGTCSRLYIIRCMANTNNESDQRNWTFASVIQSQKIQGFCLADFGTLSDKRWSRLKIVQLFNVNKRTMPSKIWRTIHLKILGILQAVLRQSTVYATKGKTRITMLCWKNANSESENFYPERFLKQVSFWWMMPAK